MLASGLEAVDQCDFGKLAMSVWYRVRGATAHLASAQDRAGIASLRSSSTTRYKNRLHRLLSAILRKGNDSPIGRPAGSQRGRRRALC